MLVLGLAAGCAGSEEPDYDDVPLNELSDADLDTICERSEKRLSTDHGALRLLCLLHAGFSGAESCNAAFSFCVDGPVPAGEVTCVHLPAEAITCEATLAELSTFCEPASDARPVEEKLREVTCEAINNDFMLIADAAGLGRCSPPNPALGNCLGAISNAARFAGP